MRRRYPALVVALLLVLSLVLAGCGQSDEEAIKDSIHTFAAAYNASDYEGCLDHLEGVDESNLEEVLSTLGVARAIVLRIDVLGIEVVSIDGPSASVQVSTRATLGPVLGGMSPDQVVSIDLTKSDGKWKFDFAPLAEQLMAGIASMLEEAPR